MIIRDQQMAVFEQAVRQNFEDEMVEHLKKFAPAHCAVIGEPSIRQVIRLGMERSQKYGLTERNSIRIYLELMVLFGSDFDTDPQVPWAGEVLKNSAAASEVVRLDSLYQKFTEHLSATAGAHFEYELESLRLASRQGLSKLRVSAGDVESGAVAYLKRIHPHKSAHVGETVLRTLARGSLELARKHSFSPESGVVLVAWLRFQFGHGCTTDPQFPWIAATLNDRALSTPDARIETLHARTKAYLNHLLRSVSGG
jgi:hypothetical protein